MDPLFIPQTTRSPIYTKIKLRLGYFFKNIQARFAHYCVFKKPASPMNYTALCQNYKTIDPYPAYFLNINTILEKKST